MIQMHGGSTVKEIHEEKFVNQKRTFLFSKGITYFDKKTERTFFFILTIVMLVWGVLAKFSFLTG